MATTARTVVTVIALLCLISQSRAEAQQPAALQTAPQRLACGTLDTRARNRDVRNWKISLLDSAGNPLAIVDATASGVPGCGAPTSGVLSFEFAVDSSGGASALRMSGVTFACTYRLTRASCVAPAGEPGQFTLPRTTPVRLTVRGAPVPMRMGALALPPPPPPAPPSVDALYVTDRHAVSLSFDGNRASTDVRVCAGMLDGCYLSTGFVTPANANTLLCSAPGTPSATNACVAAILTRLNADPRFAQSHNLLLFVPGFNHDFPSSIDDARVLSGALAASSPYVAVLAYTWPTRAAEFGVGAPLKYADDETNNSWAALHLRMVVRDLLQQDPKLRLHFMAHSMGNRLIMDALLALRLESLGMTSGTPCKPAGTGGYCGRIGQVVNIEADTDQQSYAEQALLLSDFVDGMTLYASSIDKALGWSQWLHGHCRASQIQCGDAHFAAPVTVVDATELRNCDPIWHHSYWSVSDLWLSDLEKIVPDQKPIAERSWLHAVDAPFAHYAFDTPLANAECRPA